MTDLKAWVVAVLDLRVMVTQDDGLWFAQGLQVDYAAQGRSWMEVRKAFEDGLTASIDAHLRKYGHLKHFDQPAPQHVWQEFKNAKQRAYSRITLHLHAVDFKRAEIEFIEVEKAAA